VSEGPNYALLASSATLKLEHRVSRLSVLSLAHHDPPSPGVYPPLPAARVAPRLPQGPVRWVVESRPSSPPAPTPARASRAHTRTASYSPCTGEPSARLLVSPPPRRAAMSALRPRLASRDSLPPPASKGTPMRHTPSRWLHPFLALAALGHPNPGALAPLCPPLNTHPRASAASPPVWSWGHLIPPLSPAHHPLDEHTFASKVRANLLVKRTSLS
jgi:hypothetical protein